MSDIIESAQSRLAAMTRPEVRQFILDIQDEISRLPQIELDEPKHWFTDGIYSRELFIAADTFVVGKIHRHAHLNILSAGEVTVLTEWGLERFKAPHSFISKPGTKRVVYAHTDAVWTTIHRTDKTSLEEIEAEIIAKHYGELPYFEEVEKVEG